MAIVLLFTGCGSRSSDGGLFDLIEDPKTWSKTYEQYQNDSKYIFKEESNSSIILTTAKPLKVYGVDVSPEFWFEKSNGGPPVVIYIFAGDKEEKSGKFTTDLTAFYKSVAVEMINKYNVTNRRYFLSPNGGRPDTSTPCISATDILSIPRPELDYVDCGNMCSVDFENGAYDMHLTFAMFHQGDSFSLRIAPKDN